MALKSWKKVNTWRIKGPFLAVAFLLGLFDHALHWGSASFAAGTAVLIPIIGFRVYWNRWKFWGTIAAMTILQVPAVAALRPFIERSGFPLLFAFGTLDCALVIAGICFVCGDDGDDVRRGVGNNS